MKVTGGLRRLRDAYQRATADSFGLFLGAGVNLPAGEARARYQTYTWKGLLEALYNRNQELFAASFEELLASHAQDWVGLAEALVGAMGTEQLVEQIEALLYAGLPRQDKRGRLSVRLLNQAPSLQAAICFSSRIRARTRTSWTFERNPLIGGVITSNYDFFFGAGWTRYQAFKQQWKVHTPFSQDSPNERQRTVNYIHGYVPYRPGQKRELVLDRESYARAYASSGFARRVLKDALRDYRLLFLGTSFSDPPLREMLAQAPRADRRKHFAFVTSDRVATVEGLGLDAVEVGDYAEVAEALKRIYCRSLTPEDWRPFGLEDPESYWEVLKRGPTK